MHMTHLFNWSRFWRIAPAYLRTSARREWQLALLALAGLAPGVAALTAWLNLAWLVQHQPQVDALPGWLLPTPLLDALGGAGVLVGAGVVTLLVGGLSLAHLYLASIERRSGELGLLAALGLRRLELNALLLLESGAAGLLGSGVGLLLGLALSRASWDAASQYFGLTMPYTFDPLAALVGMGAGLLVALLFMGFSAVILVTTAPSQLIQRHRPVKLLADWQAWRTTALGVLFAGLLAWLVGNAALSSRATWLLTGLAVGLGGLLSSSGWLLTRLYPHLPMPANRPLWAMAVQGLVRYPRHTTALSLALTTGSYSVGLAALSWLAGGADSRFPFWVATMVLLAGACLTLTAAALAALERRRDYALLMALGARHSQVWRLILLEYAIVAVGGGLVGALLALINWAGAQGAGGWFWAVALVLADLLGALAAAWAGAIPVLWMVTRRRKWLMLNG